MRLILVLLTILVALTVSQVTPNQFKIELNTTAGLISFQINREWVKFFTI